MWRGAGRCYASPAARVVRHFRQDLVDILKNRVTVAKYRFAAMQRKEQDKQE
jgi:hypothetical protein